jgi:tetratricopeptide (TPR) repeat protein
MRSKRCARATLAALLIYVAMLLPILGFLNIFFMLYSLVADHWQYVGMPTIITLVVAGGVSVFSAQTDVKVSESEIPNSTLSPRVGVSLAVVVSLGLMVLTWRQQAMYRDTETLYRSIIARDPKCWMAHNNLGATLYDRDRKDEALAKWRAVIRIKPDHPEAHNNIGRVLSERADNSGDPKERLWLNSEALKWCQEALVHRPNWGPVHWNVARLLTKTGGDLRLAEYHFLQGLKENPADENALYDLAVVIGQQARYAEALVYFDRCLQVNPERAEAHHGLAAVLTQLGRPEEALAHLRRSVEIKPDLVEGHTDLGNFYFNRRQYQQAVHHYRQALQSRPEFLNAANNLAVAYGELGRFKEATATAETALSLVEANGDPDVAAGLRRSIEGWRQAMKERD